MVEVHEIDRAGGDIIVTVDGVDQAFAWDDELLQDDFESREDWVAHCIGLAEESGKDDTLGVDHFHPPMYDGRAERWK